MSFQPDSRTVTSVVPSPNHEPRHARVDILVLHYTGMTTEEEALARLVDREAKVSAHYFVYEDGRVVQMVPEQLRAWHAGVGSWKHATDINARSIGIEIANPGHEWGYRDFPDAQIDAVIALSRDIVGRHHIHRDRVLAHSDVAPARKNDPGERFPWARLAAAGIGLVGRARADHAGADAVGERSRRRTVEKLQHDLARFGYGLRISRQYDDDNAPRGHGVPASLPRPERVDGLADPSTVETLRRLLTGVGWLSNSLHLVGRHPPGSGDVRATWSRCARSGRIVLTLSLSFVTHCRPLPGGLAEPDGTWFPGTFPQFFPSFGAPARATALVRDAEKTWRSLS